MIRPCERVSLKSSCNFRASRYPSVFVDNKSSKDIVEVKNIKNKKQSKLGVGGFLALNAISWGVTKIKFSKEDLFCAVCDFLICF